MKCYFHDSLKKIRVFKGCSHLVNVLNLCPDSCFFMKVVNVTCNLPKTVSVLCPLNWIYSYYWLIKWWLKSVHSSYLFRKLNQWVSVSGSFCHLSHFIKRSKWMMCLCESVWGRAGRWMWSDTNSQWALTHCWRAQETHVRTCLQSARTVALLTRDSVVLVWQTVRSLVLVWF